MSFWYAKSESKGAQIVLLGVPLEQTTTGIPGTRLGPDRIRAYSENVEAYSPYFKQDLTDIPITDAGNLEFDYLPSMESKLELISQQIVSYISSDSKPLLIGGEHTLTLGAVQAMTHKYPDLCLLQLDAHADLRDVGESGSRIAHDTVMKRVIELLKPDSLFQLGIRSFAKEEIKLVKSWSKAGQKIVKRWSKDSQKIVKSWSKDTGVTASARSAVVGYNSGSPQEREPILRGEKVATRGRMRRISDLKSHTFGEVSKPIWLTLDLDVLDPSIMPAVGTPEPGGMSYRELLDLLLGFQGLNFVGADIVEYNPLAADFAAPGVVAANLVREICCLLA